VKQGDSNITQVDRRKAIRDIEMRGGGRVRNIFAAEEFEVRRHH
jgi:hypothetical protein